MTWVTSEFSPDPDPEQDESSSDSGPQGSAGTVPPAGEQPESEPQPAPVEDPDAGFIDEPPIDPLADTNPSITMPPVSIPPDENDDDIPMWRHVVGLAMLLGAAALTIVAGLIVFIPLLQGGGEETPAPPTSAAVIPTATVVAPDAAAQQAAPPIVFPTLSPEDIAALLATPPGSDDAPGIIEREDSPFTIIPERARAEVISYTIEEGDTISAIAERFGLEKDTIAWSNDRQTVFALRPGNTLFIMPVDGVYHRALVDQTIQSIADEYDVDPYDIISSEFNDLFGATPDTIIRSGTYVVVPGGTSNYNDWNYNPVVQRTSGGGGGSSSAGFISFAPGQPGSCGSQPNPGGTGYFSRPLNSYSWVRGFTGYHSGVDLAAAEGTPVFASSPGRVIYRGWNNWGYGYLVVLAHGPFTTFYAHLSSINVSCGQMVGAGQVIGGVGTTGNSSGNHLHFEIRYNDIATDPLLYLGF